MRHPSGLLARHPWLADLAALASLLALLAVTGGRYLVRVHDSWVPGGWDGVAHFAMAEIYAERIFPAVSGWVPEYFAGMPFPDFYPPLFYWLVAALIRLGVEPKSAFLGLETLLSAALPLLAYAGARRLARDRVAGWVAGALTVAFLVDTHPLSSFGITLTATFGVGLASQPLGFALVLAFYYFFLGADRSRRQAALAALCLGLTALANVHVLWDAVFLFVGLAAARLAAAPSWRERRRSLARDAAVGAGGILVSAVWVLPMLARLDHVPTMALEPPPVALVALAFLRLTLYVVLSVVVARAERNHAALGLAASLVLLLAASTLPTGRAAAHLALQPARFLIGFEFLSAFLVGTMVAAVGRVARWPHAKVAAGLAVVALFFGYVRPVGEPTGNIGAEDAASYAQALVALAGRDDGRVLVEMGNGSLADAFALQALVPRSGAPSLTTVFRESALTSLFAAPLRNSLSENHELFGIDSKLPDPARLAAQPAAAHLARLDLFNVRYLVLRSPKARRRAEGTLPVRRLGGDGSWAVYELDVARRPYARVPAYEPVLTFTSFSVKPRPDDGLDFVRLGEEMFAAGRLEVPLALAPEPLDGEPGWERFRAALLVEHRYRDLERAFAAVERFSRDRPVVFVEDGSPLAARLTGLAPTRPTLLRPVRRTTPAATVQRLLDELDRVRVPVEGPAVASAELAGGRATISLSAPPAREVPVWVHQGYLPGWANLAGQPVYLATPTFQLTWADRRELALEYRPLPAAWIGAALSLLGAVGLAAWALRRGASL